MESKVINGKEYLFVQVPEDTISYRVFKSQEKYFHVNYDYMQQGMSGGFALFYKEFGGKHKYPTELILIGKASKLTEEQWELVVEGMPEYYLDYEADNDNNVITYVHYATESGMSLLKSMNLNPSTTLIIQKLNNELA